MKNKGTNQLKSDRLLLRKFLISDAQCMYDNWAKDEENTYFMSWPKHESLDVTKAILSSWIESYRELDFYQWAIVLLDNPCEVIGSISLMNQINNSIEIGYCLSKKYWNQGIATEASKLVIKYAFDELLFDEIRIYMDVKNVASEKVAKKLGGKNMGQTDVYFPLKHKSVTCYYYAIDKKIK